MTIPQWVLLGFAAWTLIVLLVTVGIYRWSRILSGRVRISVWRADERQGSEWYCRAMRAHANCVENLPVYGAVVLCASIARINAPLLDMLALTLLGARVAQTITHVAFRQTDRIVSIRFGWFFAQLLCMVAMGANVAISALRETTMAVF